MTCKGWSPRRFFKELASRFRRLAIWPYIAKVVRHAEYFRHIEHSGSKILKGMMNNERCKILIVDDDELSGWILEQRIYKLLGNTVRVDRVSSDVEALKLWRLEAYNVAFIDIEMPKMNGIEVVNRLRRQRAHECLFIAYTGLSRKEELDHVMNPKNGFHDLLLKPAQKEKLAQVLEGLPAKGPLSRAPDTR